MEPHYTHGKRVSSTRSRVCVFEDWYQRLKAPDISIPSSKMYFLLLTSANAEPFCRRIGFYVPLSSKDFAVSSTARSTSVRTDINFMTRPDHDQI